MLLIPFNVFIWKPVSRTAADLKNLEKKASNVSKILCRWNLDNDGDDSCERGKSLLSLTAKFQLQARQGKRMIQILRRRVTDGDSKLIIVSGGVKLYHNLTRSSSKEPLPLAAVLHSHKKWRVFETTFSCRP